METVNMLITQGFYVNGSMVRIQAFHSDIPVHFDDIYANVRAIGCVDNSIRAKRWKD